jgi:hypothetical protein
MARLEFVSGETLTDVGTTSTCPGTANGLGRKNKMTWIEVAITILEAETESSRSGRPAQMRQPEPSLAETSNPREFPPRVLGDMAVGPEVFQDPVDWAAVTPQRTSAASTRFRQTIFTSVLRSKFRLPQRTL